jgi:Gentisate 1,2-dioxygenase
MPFNALVVVRAPRGRLSAKSQIINVERDEMNTSIQRHALKGISTLCEDVQLFEYSKAANPIASGATPPVPVVEFSSELYGCGPSRIIPLDLSEQLRTPAPATGPAVLANFIRIEKGDQITEEPNASSVFIYVIRGSGRTQTKYGEIEWKVGDCLTAPGGRTTHCADQESVLYAVNDSPIFAYLGARYAEPRFSPTLYTREMLEEALRKAEQDPAASSRSRISILLGNRQFNQTMTITHTLWAMFGVVPSGARQMPHRHQSVAVDFVVDAKPGVYTLLGPILNDNGAIRNPVRVDWKSGAVFVTPPGYWHEHRNESDNAALILPIQDAGLHTYLRTLDIRFHHQD